MEVFESWMSEYNKNYSSMEEKLHRFEIFRKNLKLIDEINNKKVSYWCGLNHFADLSHEEFKSSYCSGLNVEFPRNKSTEFRYRDVKDLPESVDWRSKGVVTSVKNQGDCSASWAFSAVASVEGINQIVTGNLIDLSAQELIDCDIFNNGCNGGLMHNAFQYIMSSDGLRKEMDYPYLMKKGLCKGNKTEFEVVTISGYEEVPRNDEQSLLKAISCQPVSVAVDASDLGFQFYKGGVYKGSVFKYPSGFNLNHAVTAVGYGSSKGEDYIILKNSWGEKWGEEGYMRIQRNSCFPEGICGINKLASYPTKQK